MSTTEVAPEPKKEEAQEKKAPVHLFIGKEVNGKLVELVHNEKEAEDGKKWRSLDDTTYSENELEWVMPLKPLANRLSCEFFVGDVLPVRGVMFTVHDIGESRMILKPVNREAWNNLRTAAKMNSK